MIYSSAWTCNGNIVSVGPFDLCFSLKWFALSRDRYIFILFGHWKVLHESYTILETILNFSFSLLGNSFILEPHFSIVRWFFRQYFTISQSSGQRYFGKKKNVFSSLFSSYVLLIYEKKKTAYAINGGDYLRAIFSQRYYTDVNIFNVTRIIVQRLNEITTASIVRSFYRFESA